MTVEPEEPGDTSGSAGVAGKAGSGGTSGTAGKGGSGGSSGSGGTGGSAGTAGTGGAGGSGGSGGSGVVLSSEGFAPFECKLALPGAAAALDLDSIELWHKSGYTDVGAKVESDGVPCLESTAEKNCVEDLEQARNAIWDEGLLVTDHSGKQEAERFVVTEGGVVSLVANQPELRRLILPVDSPEKLRLAIRYQLKDPYCQFVRQVEGGYELIAVVSTGGSPCDQWTQRQLLGVSDAGEVTLIAAEDPKNLQCGGRRPAGLSAQALTSSGALCRYLERQAYLEAASVEAFERMARELASFGAPPGLVEQTRRAREDEVRHHALLVSLGRRFDPSFSCQPPEAAPARPRSRFEFALENAVEGCVRETWGALVAHHQAARARDGAVRFASALIADDETRHAELSWATHAWLLERLGEGERRTIDEAMARAAQELLAGARESDGLDEGDRARLGLPSPDEARVLLERLHAALWSKPLAA